LCAFSNPRRDAGVVYLARLESVYTRKGIEGSNPSLSAINNPVRWILQESVRSRRFLKGFMQNPSRAERARVIDCRATLLGNTAGNPSLKPLYSPASIR